MDMWTHFCTQGQYVIAGCSEGMLHVWMWETGVEICHISAHKELIHDCTLLPNAGKHPGMSKRANQLIRENVLIRCWYVFQSHCSKDESKEVGPEEMTVLTASDDGTVQLWKPLQVRPKCPNNLAE